MSLNPANTQISAGTAWAPIYVRGQANTAQLLLSGEAGNVTPSACTYTLLNPTGTTVVTGAATVAAGSCTFALTAVHLPATQTTDAGYIERWTLTINGVTKPYEREVFVGLRDLLMPVRLTDLTSGRYPTLNNQQARATDTWQGLLEGAWGELLRRVASDGLLAYRLLSPSTLRDPHEHLTLERIFNALGMSAADPNAGYLRLVKEHAEKYERAYTAMRASLDRDDDGRIDDPNALPTVSQSVIHVNASPYPERPGQNRANRWW